MPQLADTLTFLRAWIADPLRVGSAIPSSDHLATIITSEINPIVGPVLELGPGTGVFTQALIRRGIRPENLTLVELGENFADILARRYPDAMIVRVDAAYFSKGNLPQSRRHGAAISGLPLLSMPAAKVLRILTNAFRLLDNDAGFYQFTYGWRCPVPHRVLERLDLKAEKVGTELRNFPPASVYRIVRQGYASGLQSLPKARAGRTLGTDAECRPKRG
jgi:phosphatidylethanolamine/phosphatidyl-N-methylethanolamine N-methyltransferase